MKKHKTKATTILCAFSPDADKGGVYWGDCRAGGASAHALDAQVAKVCYLLLLLLLLLLFYYYYIYMYIIFCLFVSMLFYHHTHTLVLSLKTHIFSYYFCIIIINI